jgi:hypothetical protein
MMLILLGVMLALYLIAAKTVEGCNLGGDASVVSCNQVV